MTAPDSFRYATADDADGLAVLVHSAYRGDTSRRGWTTEADLLDGQRIGAAQVRGVIADPGSRLLVVEDADGVLACCQVEDRGDGVAYFGMFAVRPGHQGGGVGRRVVALAETVARTEFGARLMEMTVIWQRAELVAWYERLGYVATGETRPFPYGDPRFGIPRRDDLYFVVLQRGLDQAGAK